MLPDYSDPITLASTFNMYFIDKIANIRAEFPLLESSLPPYSFGSMDSIMPTCANLFDRFTMITSEELIKIVYVMNKTTCSSDPFPSRVVNSWNDLPEEVVLADSLNQFKNIRVFLET